MCKILIYKMSREMEHKCSTQYITVCSTIKILFTNVHHIKVFLYIQVL